MLSVEALVRIRDRALSVETSTAAEKAVIEDVSAAFGTQG
jgi:hypothetical protein